MTTSQPAAFDVQQPREHLIEDGNRAQLLYCQFLECTILLPEPTSAERR